MTSIAVRRGLLWTSAAAVFALSGLILVNSWPYFSLRGNFGFLAEKGAVADDVHWRAAFYVHVAGGMACLATGPLLLWAGLLRRSPRAHRWLGRVYALAVLGCAGPSGIYMSFQSRGGLPGALGFLSLGVLWWTATARGVRDVIRGKVAEHRRWMLRSYALALSAVFFRVIQLAIEPLGVAYDVNYVVSLWLSLAASVAVGEWLVRRPARREAVVKGVEA